MVVVAPQTVSTLLLQRVKFEYGKQEGFSDTQRDSSFFLETLFHTRSLFKGISFFIADICFSPIFQMINLRKQRYGKTSLAFWQEDEIDLNIVQFSDLLYPHLNWLVFF